MSGKSALTLLSCCDSGLALKGGSHPDIEPSMVLERPKVLFNARTSKFVMWMHIDTADYELAHLGVAVSDHPLGPFKYLGSFRPHGQQSRDFTVFAVGLCHCDSEMDPTTTVPGLLPS